MRVVISRKARSAVHHGVGDRLDESSRCDNSSRFGGSGRHYRCFIFFSLTFSKIAVASNEIAAMLFRKASADFPPIDDFSTDLIAGKRIAVDSRTRHEFGDFFIFAEKQNGGDGRQKFIAGADGQSKSFFRKSAVW